MGLTECRLTPLETRRLKGNHIEVFKILNGYETIYREVEMRFDQIGSKVESAVLYICSPIFTVFSFVW